MDTRAIGFCGTFCENRVPLLSEYEASSCNASRAALFANNRCNKECNTVECFFDGLDCHELPEYEIWMDLGSATQCLNSYGNDICDENCNSYMYGFDGGDCEKELRGMRKAKIHISLAVKPDEEAATAAWLEIFLAVTISMLITLIIGYDYNRMLDPSSSSSIFKDKKNRLVAAVEEGNVSSLTALLTGMTPLEAANAEDVAGNTVLHMAGA
ncbi:hypothetical protein PRIPAC_81107 [Pristionchus pacificus]|uniref:Uncharacterized protein n=1 Tax=Pristionchus pacificus TaxID=54126 RepID=A0A2A6BXL9_PRIPA|nr:hypothetical protein PRIPAC_81107 [Pristionchus pacificus]|eukprot:PDM70628.1 hypothetical protein PRIPAC_46874 [Pristionchus pacificus]